jgi:hypothetical protein
MLLQIAKRLARRPMSECELLEYCANLIANPPLPDDVRSALTTRKYTDGRSFIEGWRSEFKTLLAQISAEKTWTFQRQKLIHFRVAAVFWIALYRAAGTERRISLWRGYVKGVDEFSANPEDAWPSILAKVFYFANLQNATLCPLGMAYYGTDEALERHLNALRDMRQHAIEKGIVLDRGILDIDAVDPDLGESLMTARNEKVYPHHQRLSGFLREFGDRIETGAVKDAAIIKRWEDLCHDLNAQILTIGPGGAIDGATT